MAILLQRSQCLWYALERIHTEGGYLIFRKSAHWCMPHVMYLSPSGELSHYVPPDKLKRPWHSLVGFEGVVVHDDNPSDAKPLGFVCMFFGTSALMILGGVWLCLRGYNAIRRTIFK